MSQGTRQSRGRASSSAGRADAANSTELVCKTARKMRKADPNRIVFLRLYEDVIDELTTAVARRVEAGVSKGSIAEKAGLAPALLSRVLGGRSGTNLRTIAALLNGTDHRLKVMAVPCEHMQTFDHVWSVCPTDNAEYVRFVSTEGGWQDPIDLAPSAFKVAVINTSEDEVHVNA
jgi:hypothetical protein